MSETSTKLRGGQLTTRRYAGPPALQLLGKPEPGRTFSLTEREMIIGRSEECPIYIEEDGLSRRHAKVVLAAADIVNLVDLGSTNGTFVNGFRVDVTVLKHGDVIGLGPDVRLSFAAGSTAAAPPEEVSEALPLTARQIEVARLVAEGLTNAQIAKRLGISHRTVTSHLDHIYERLDISSRAALSTILARAGVLTSKG